MKKHGDYSYYRGIDRDEMNKALLEKRIEHAKRVKQKREDARKTQELRINSKTSHIFRSELLDENVNAVTNSNPLQKKFKHKNKKKYKSRKSGIEAYPYVHQFVHILYTPMGSGKRR